MAYCYNADSRNQDVFERSVAPMVAQVLEGYNVNIIVLGSTGSGKTTLLEGMMGQGSGGTGGIGGDGIVHHALDRVFDSLHKRSISVRAPPSTGHGLD